ncbi:serine/threonine-protein kinase [Candidatus Uabimicrobium amorphum]|uniref:non-specific serine/threonine protein kinase n=1 Tax=Uabimicrobium amorphum TaxID=2596890 RepID=A0A5S9ISV5_UABAM|nr:serine/threonine-protein kinase [Candidatus Uabimicrobium amorphum]BBM86520.1 serine/threonine protein kinase [Candidatus Uabimicrobium amorphum]
MDLVKINKWQLQDGTVLHTQQVFSKLVMKEITPLTMCRSEQSDWQPIQNTFKVIERYGILKELGEGAFGKVYLGLEVQKNDGRFVAIKMPTKKVLSEYARDSQRSSSEGMAFSRNAIGQLFSQESLLTARLSMCPYVVKVLDHNVTVPYMVLEYCNGGSLAERIVEPYTTQELLQWAFQISSALAAAHGLTPDSLIHRDLKPQNILLHDGQIKVSDFGTSQMTYQNESIQSIHGGGYTPKYASPEALNGKAHPNTDVWSLGVILYFLISKTFPFEADGMLPLMKKIASDDFVPVIQKRAMDVDDSICQFVDRCLDKDPKKRPSSMECAEFFSADKSPSTGRSNITTARRTRQTKRDSIVTRRRMAKEQPAAKKNNLLYVIAAAMLCICGLLSFLILSGSSKYPSPQIEKIFQITSKTNFEETPSGVGVVFTRSSPKADWTALIEGGSLSQQHDYYFGFKLKSNAYAYIFQIDTKGQLFWVFPKNSTSREFSTGKNPVRKDEWYRVPDGHFYKLDNTLGLEHVYMVFCPKRWVELENALKEAAANNEQMRSATITKHFENDRSDTRRGIGTMHKLVAPPRGVKVTNPKSDVFRLIAGERGVLIFERWFYHVSGS